MHCNIVRIFNNEIPLVIIRSRKKKSVKILRLKHFHNFYEIFFHQLK